MTNHSVHFAQLIVTLTAPRFGHFLVGSFRPDHPPNNKAYRPMDFCPLLCPLILSFLSAITCNQARHVSLSRSARIPKSPSPRLLQQIDRISTCTSPSTIIAFERLLLLYNAFVCIPGRAVSKSRVCLPPLAVTYVFAQWSRPSHFTLLNIQEIPRVWAGGVATRFSVADFTTVFASSFHFTLVGLKLTEIEFWVHPRTFCPEDFRKCVKAHSGHFGVVGSKMLAELI